MEKKPLSPLISLERLKGVVADLVAVPKATVVKKTAKRTKRKRRKNT